MRRQDAYELGQDRGRCVASWVDSPEVGQEISRELDWVGYRIVDDENRQDVFSMICGEAESNGRDFTPWEHTAHALNSLPEDGRDPETGQFTLDPETAWEAYDEGISAGIEAESASRDWSA